MPVEDLDLITPSPPEWAQNLDMDAYLIRQGHACVYMEKVIDRIRTLEPELFLACHQIRDVHRHQYRLISELVPLGMATHSVDTSFYFTSLYKELGCLPASKNPRRFILAHVVGYLRGHDRYCRLLEAGREHGPLWNLFQGHAKENARKLATGLVRMQGMPSVVMTWAVVMEAEERLMRTIWEHNGLPVPPRE